MQAVAPLGEFAYVPARHGMQDIASGALFVPFGHVEQEEDRFSDANFPDSHDIHTVAPFGEIEYVPARHGMQDCPSDALFVPFGQESQIPASAVGTYATDRGSRSGSVSGIQYCPASHLVRHSCVSKSNRVSELLHPHKTRL